MSENLTEQQILDNVSNLLITSENIVNTYYDMFYDTTAKDVTFTYINLDGTETTVTVPNRAKCKITGLEGEVDPNQSTASAVTNANIGTVYIYQNGQSYTAFVKTSRAGNVWEQLLNSNAIAQHNVSPEAHDGYLAKISGDPNIPFNVGTPTADSHAVNVNYVGALGDLKTLHKSDVVGAVNEVYDSAQYLADKVSSLSGAPIFCANKGNLDAEGNPDLLIDAGAPWYYYDKTTENYTDNSADFRTSSNFGDSQNTWSWGNSGAPFGAPLGGGLSGYSIHYGPSNGWGGAACGPQSGNVGCAGRPIIHTFTTPLSAGRYKFNCASNGGTYRLWYVTADVGTLANTETFEVPLPTLSSSQWTEVPTASYIIVPEGKVIAQIKAESTASSGYWYIGAIHLIQYVENPDYENVLYFKVGNPYDNLTCTDIDGVMFTRTGLSPITVNSETYGVGDYNILVPRTGNAYLHNGDIYRQPKEPVPYYANYTVNGNNIQVSDDYVASGFSSASGTGVIMTNTLANYRSVNGTDTYLPWEVVIAHTPSTVTGTQRLFTSSLGSTYYYPVLQTQGDGKYHLYVSSNGSSWNVVNNLVSNYTTTVGNYEQVKFGWTGSQYYIDIFNYVWEPKTSQAVSANNFVPRNIIYGNGVYVALGNSDSVAGTSQYMMYSYDSETWSLGVISNNLNIVSCAFYKGKFYALASNGKIIISENGIDWESQEQDLDTSKTWLKLIQIGNDLYAISRTLNVCKTPDGTTWQYVRTASSEESMFDVCYGGGKLIAVYGSNTNYYVSENSGVSWTLNSYGTGSFTQTYSTKKAIVYGNSMFIVMNLSEQETSLSRTVLLNDQWTYGLITSSLGSGAELNFAYGNNKFVVSVIGPSDVISSGVWVCSDNTGSTWQIDDDGEFPEVSGDQPVPTTLAYVNGKFILGTKGLDSVNTSFASYTSEWVRNASSNSSSGMYQSPYAPMLGGGIIDTGVQYSGTIDLKNTYMTVAGKKIWTCQELKDGDIWVNTAFLPLTAQKRLGDSWVSFNDVPIGKITVDSAGLIVNPTTYQYNSRSVSTPNSTLPATVVEAYKKGNEWYRVWSDGYIEQGGFVSQLTQVVFLVPFNTNTYTITGIPSTGDAGFWNRSEYGVRIDGTNVLWKACGY